MFSLIDCNNFFVSCERVFNPLLHKKPVVVLSNNDGCVIARSEEAKALQIPMGAPIFKYKQKLLLHDVIALSSNFTLYADLSKRVFALLEDFGLPIEIYSVDEAFLDVSSIAIQDLEAFGKRVKDQIKKWIGIPVSIGFARSKTLAKMAGEVAKKKREHHGVFVLESADELLKQTPIDAVWGIGRNLTPKMKSFQIHTAYDLTIREENWVKKVFSVVVLKTQLELKGMPCISFMVEDTIPKSMLYSRSLKKEIEDSLEIEKLIATFTAKLALKLRKKKLTCCYLNVFLHGNRFKEGSFFESSLQLPLSTNYTPALIQAAKSLLKGFLNNPFAVKRLGILLMDLSPENEKQLSLLENESLGKSKVMETFDLINRKFKDGQIRFASELSQTAVISQRDAVSNKYTTSWDELLTIQI
jgi:DNA polymerase V